MSLELTCCCVHYGVQTVNFLLQNNVVCGAENVCPLYPVEFLVNPNIVNEIVVVLELLGPCNLGDNCTNNIPDL